MTRPQTKAELIAAATKTHDDLMTFIDSMSPKELTTPFDFSTDTNKTEAHWNRDKNLRDVLIHLYEWHQLLLTWISSNLNGHPRPFLPEPYNWKNYGEMNMMFWKKHQSTSLDKAKQLFERSYAKVIELVNQFSDAELFERGAYPWTGTPVLASSFISSTSSHYRWALKKLKAHRRKCNISD